MQEQEGDERIVAKSKPTTMNLAFIHCLYKQNPIASKSPRILMATCQNDWTSTGKPRARKFNQDAASSSQGWQEDAVLGESTRRLAATGSSDTEGKDKILPHNSSISTDCVPHVEKVFSIVRQRYNLSPKDKMEDLDVNSAIWGLFLSVTLQAAVHPDFSEKICVLPRISPRNHWDSFFSSDWNLWLVRLRRKVQGYSKHPVEQIGQVQGNLTQKNTIEMQRWVVKNGKKMQFCSTRKTRRDRRRPGTPELYWKIQ